ncbi:urea ABC transporter permease subunit UrtC [Agrobacterium tumefaciens]|uniref:urea ABC transporter permease subunit UrtC n=1 Tax=Agrobacterium tumefaciens TaxID=358 RepID=UPI00287D99DC|nr:urea ABC transporter permease subunit UrtC [Agrobacterium tumefaciens]MDS7595452.1 urea ABC transporter permease subunit UrtC [Agrobacterium tumefaciens]
MESVKIRGDLLTIIVSAAVLGCAPLVLDAFWLQNLGKYLAFAFVALGIVITWGYCGILSLGQGIFFGIGGYALAIYLKLEATGGELPDFMGWSGIETLPIWWQPFENLGFAVATIVALPVLLAFPFAFLLFRKRVNGVYFAIVTLVLALTASILLVGQQSVTGGANGITDFSTIAGFDLYADETVLALYVIELCLLMVAVALSMALLKTRLGKIIVAIRDREDRVRFSGYDTALLKAAVFAFAAVLSSVGGAMFTLQVGLVTPTIVGTVVSVEMVIYAAVGGRLSPVGAVVGAILVGFLKSYLSEQFPEAWLFFLGGCFIVVVAFMPNGLAGLQRDITSRLINRKEI